MAQRPLSVLVVEDHPTIARQVVDFLEGLQWQPDHAATGALAIELATREPYDVVLLDLNLPDLDGLEVCRAIKAHAPRNQYWLRQNGIAPGATSNRVIDADPADGTTVSWTEAGNGEQRVALATIENGGHTWPGADPFNVGLPIGATTRDVDANEVMWEFFSRHRTATSAAHR